MSVDEAFNMKRLIAGGIKSITVPYSGGGDDGHVDHSDIESEPSIDFSDRQRGLLANIAYQVLDNCQVPDWHNNDGGQGKIVFTIREDNEIAWTVHHETNITESTNSKTEGIIEDGSLSPELVAQLDAIYKGELLKFHQEHPDYGKDNPNSIIGPIGVRYYGSGGGIDRMEVYVTETTLDTTPMANTAEALVQMHYPNWESEDGGSGDVYFEVKDGKVHYRIEHSAYTRITEDEEHEGVLGDEEQQEVSQ